MRTHLQGRSVLLWSAASFLCLQTALAIVLVLWPPLRDPEYGVRLQSLRARLAERPDKRPVLFLGSSRIACTLRCDMFPSNSGEGDGPVVFNFGICGSGPVMELLCLRRLLADGVRPKCLFVEVWPQAVLIDAAGQMQNIQLGRLRWDDLPTLRPFHLSAPFGSPQWIDRQLNPLWTYRDQMLDLAAPGWFESTDPDSRDWARLDGWGWRAVPRMKSNMDGRGRERAEAVAKKMVPLCNKFAPSDDSLRAYNEIFALCRREKIEVALVAMPDAFLASYSSTGKSLIDSFICRLSRDNHLALIDARAWIAPEGFFDGVHLTHAAAAVFTQKFGHGVLDPYLKGEPLSYRWPAGCLDRSNPDATPADPSHSTAAQ